MNEFNFIINYSAMSVQIDCSPQVLSIHLWCFFILGVFLNFLLQKVPYFLCKLCLFYVLFFLTTLRYHSNKFLELKPKDEVTLLSPGLFWLILKCSKLQFFPFIS